MKRLELTEQQHKFVLDNYLKMSCYDLSLRLGVGEHGLRRYYKRKGLIVPKHISIGFRVAKQLKPFTKEEDSIILQNLAHKAIKKLAKELKRAPDDVSRRAKELGLSDIINQKSRDSHYKPGSVPLNKGKNSTNLCPLRQF